jgi:hypothetical protein
MAQVTESALAMTIAVLFGAVCATAVPPAHSAPLRSVPHLSIAEPALAAPADSPSPPPALADNPPPATDVHLPLFGDQPTGPAPAPRAGSALLVPSVGLHVGVVDYGDCSGNTPMTRSNAVHFLCTPSAVSAFVGHNPGVFTPLLQTHPGDRVTYQHDGVADVYVIGAAKRVTPQEAAAYTQDGSYAHMVLATCAEPDSSAYWIFLATPLNGTSGSSGQQPAPGGGGGGGGTRPAPSPSPSPSPSPGGILGVPIPPLGV